MLWAEFSPPWRSQERRKGTNGLKTICRPLCHHPVGQISMMQCFTRWIIPFGSKHKAALLLGPCALAVNKVNKMKIFGMQQWQARNLVILSRKAKLAHLCRSRNWARRPGWPSLSPFWSLCPGMQTIEGTHCPLTLPHSPHLPSNCSNTVSKWPRCLKQALDKE